MKKYVHIILLCCVGFALLVGVLWFQQRQEVTQGKSVEFGLAESSPDGTGSGYAMPASGDSCDSDYRDRCYSSRNFCGDRDRGRVRCSGSCTARTPSDYVGACYSTPNYCGMTESGNERCDGVCIGTVNASVATPSNDLCTSLPFGPVGPNGAVGLLVSPAVVRKNVEITIEWNLGLNYPPNCTLVGPHLEGFVFTDQGSVAASQTGSTNVIVTGPHRYTLTCGNSEVTADVKVLPEIYEQ